MKTLSLFGLFFCFVFTSAVSSASMKITKSHIVWTAKKVTGSHHGNIELAEGHLIFDKNGLLTGGEFKVDMSTITVNDIPKKKEGNAKLVRHLKSDDFFSVGKFRYSTFKIRTVKRNKDRYNIEGDMTIKDQTHPLKFTANIHEKAQRKSMKADLTLDRTKWGIIYGSKNFFKNLADRAIDENFKLQIDLSTQKR